jgi:hypothetical protein
VKHQKHPSESGKLTQLFLCEVLAACAAVNAARQSRKALSTLAAERRYSDARDSLRSFFASLKPYRQFGDFQSLAVLPRPRPLELHVEPSILYGHFRAWLRKRGFDPNTIAATGPRHDGN